MSYSIRSIRKRLLECLERPTLERISHWNDASKRGRTTLINYILDNWNPDCDSAIQYVVNLAKVKGTK